MLYYMVLLCVARQNNIIYYIDRVVLDRVVIDRVVLDRVVLNSE